jgi:ribosome maturation factor RimP
MPSTVEQIENILKPILASLNIVLWDLDFKRDGPRWLLRIYIDREDRGTTLEDCETVSRDLGTVLDVEDIIPHAYTLEVSSPGLDRSLTRPEHYEKSVGKLLKVKTFQPVQEQRIIRGILKGLEGDTVALEGEHGGLFMIPLANIAKASWEVVL